MATKALAALKPQQAKIAAALGRGLSLDEISQLYNIAVDDKTVAKWRKDQAFNAAVLDAEARYMEELYPLATRRLEQQLNSPDPWITANAIRMTKQSQDMARDRASRTMVVVFANMPRPGSPTPIQAVDAEALTGEGDVT